jgi:hypothetical protein
MYKQDFHAAQGQYVVKQAAERLQDAVNTLQRCMFEVERYGERYSEADTDRERAQVVNWVINYLVCSITPNLRIDLLADSQAQLAALAQQEQRND